MRDEVDPALTGKRAEAAALWAVGWDEVSTFIGPNAERFRSAWDKVRPKALKSGSGVAFAICWPALLFGFAWFLYRRMWLAGALLLALPLVLGLFLDIGTGMAGATVAIAALAKSLHLQHAVTRIGAVKAAGGGGEAVRAAGGLSTVGGIIGGALWAVILVAAFLTLGGEPA